jgi:glycosyltransferase involved in cell wall biosynthesis
LEVNVSQPPAVSVVLTTYNREETLPATLDSILCQTFRDFELIICDDASPDGTPSVAREYVERDQRVRYHRNEPNVGMPANLNTGIRLARAQFIANLHDGDLYDPTLLEKWTAALRQSPNVAFVFNQYLHLDHKGGVQRITSEDLPSIFPGRRLIETIYFTRWRFDSPVWGTVMARRAFYEKAGLFDHRFSFFSDVDMWLRLAEDYDVAYVPEPLIVLASRKTVPTMINVPNQDAIVRRMLWEARMRHYRLNPARRSVEAIKHGVFAAALKIYRLLCETKAMMLGKIPKHT